MNISVKGKSYGIRCLSCTKDKSRTRKPSLKIELDIMALENAQDISVKHFKFSPLSKEIGELFKNIINIL